MGIFDNLFETETKTTPITTTTQMPEWVNTGAQQNWGLAKEITGKPYETFSGPRIAGFTGDQEKSFDMIRDGSGMWGADLTGAGDQFERASKALPELDMGAYLNPFTSQVVNTTVDEMNRQGAIQRKNIGLSAHRGGAYGGARHGVLEAEQMQGQNRAISEAVARLMMQNFGNAQTMAMADQDRKLAAGDRLAALGDAKSRLQLRDAAALDAAGTRQQQQNQSSLDVAKSDFDEQKRWLYDMLNYRMAALAGQPMPTSSTSEQVTAAANPFAQSVGLAAALNGLLKD